MFIAPTDFWPPTETPSKLISMLRFRIHSVVSVLSLAVVLLACPALRAQAAPAPDDTLFTASPQQLAGVKVMLAQQAAWNAGDLPAYLSRFKDAPDTEVRLGGLAVGMENIRSAYRINFPNHEAMGAIEYTDIRARALGADHTVVTASYHLQRTKKGGGDAEGTFTEIVEKTPAGWQVIFAESV